MRALFFSLAILTGNGFAAIRESFDSAQPTWQVAQADCGYRVVAHQRSLHEPHSGQASEQVRLLCGRGTFVYLTHETSRCLVIPDLTVSLWVKSDKPGMQLLARVVLPRTPDADGNGFMTALLRGSMYTEVGSWQQLRIDRFDQLMEQQTRVLRQRFGSHVNADDAYVDMVVVNAYGGAGTSDVWIDDLEIVGHVEAGMSDDTHEVQAKTQTATPNDELRGDWIRQRESARAVRLHGSIVEVEGRPMMVRMIEHNGEPLGWLQSLGFNAVQLRSPVTRAVSDEAARLGLWLVAPPSAAVGRSGEELDDRRILAWHLGDRLTAPYVEATRKLAGEVRRDGSESARPLVCSAETNLWEYSRIADIVVLDLEPLGTSFELGDCAERLRTRGRLARPGNPLWAAIQTQPQRLIGEQIAALGPGDAPPLSIQPEQIRLLAYAAVAAGARGLLFRSASALDADDPATRLRAATMQLLNGELKLIEPWVAGGTYGGEIETSNPEVQISALQTARSRLLLVRRIAEAQQFVVQPPGEHAIAFHDGAATTSTRAYRIGPTHLAPVNSLQRPGGTWINLEDAGWVTPVVLTSDELVLHHLTSQQRQQAKAAAELHYDIAKQELAGVNSTLQRLSSYGSSLPQVNESLRLAQSHLIRCEPLLATGDWRSAYRSCEQARQALARLRHETWRQATSGFTAPTASPLCTSFDTLPDHWAMSNRMRTARWSTNVLPGGAFEDLRFMQSRGWRYERSGDAEVQAAVDLAADASRSGATGLRLRCWPADDNNKPVAIEQPPIQITSAPVPVRAGQLLRIHGWVRVPAEITGSDAGLLIYDSLGGRGLGERIRVAKDWRELVLFRAATRDGHATVTFALSGMGEVQLDDVSISTVEPIQLNAGSNAQHGPSPRPLSSGVRN